MAIQVSVLQRRNNSSAVIPDHDINGWTCSCKVRRSLWANAAALHFFDKTLEQFCQQDFGQLPEGHVTPQEYSSFQTLNELLKEEVEVGKTAHFTI